MIPTFLARLKKLQLRVTDEESPLNNLDSKAKVNEIQCLLDNKKLSIGEFSLHLMAGGSIYKDIDYPAIDSGDEPAEVCPWTYPPPNHPSTLLLWKGEFDMNQESQALEANFYFEKSEESFMNSKMLGDIKIGGM